MYFIDKDGTIQEGTAISNEQKSVLETIEAKVHKDICRTYHASYESTPHKCRALALSLIESFDIKPKLQAGQGLLGVAGDMAAESQAGPIVEAEEAA